MAEPTSGSLKAREVRMGPLRLRMTERAPAEEFLLRPKFASLRSQIKKVEFLNCPQCGTAFTVENGAILTADSKLGCKKCQEKTDGIPGSFVMEIVTQGGFFKDAELGWVTAHQILAGVGCSFCTLFQNYEYIFACGHRACKTCKPPEQRPKCGKRCRGGDGPAGAGSDVLSFYVKYLEFLVGLGKEAQGGPGEGFIRNLEHLELVKRLNSRRGSISDLAKGSLLTSGSFEARKSQNGLENHISLTRRCEECEFEFDIKQFFCCTDCGKKTICGACGLSDHQTHKTVKLTIVELEGLRTEIGIEQKNLYEGLAANITGLHDCTRDAVNALLAAKKAAYGAIEQQRTLIDGHKVREEMRAAAKEFEKYVEDYIPLVRSLNDRLHETKEKLEKLSAPKTPG